MTYDYDAEDGYFKTIRTDEDGHKTSTLTDALNRVVRSEDGNGVTTEYAFDARNNILTVDGPAGPYIYDYDGLGRLEKKTVTDGGVHSYTYYPSDLLKTSSDPNTNTLFNVYNNFGQPKELRIGTESGSLLKKYTYYEGDEALQGKTGRIKTEDLATSQNLSAFVNKTYEYDEWGRLKNRSSATPYMSANFIVDQIDNADFINKMTRDDVVLHTIFDHGGRVKTSQTTWMGELLHSTFKYTDNDWIERQGLGAGQDDALQNVDYSYNERSWLTAINSTTEVADDATDFIKFPDLAEGDLFEIIINAQTRYNVEYLFNCLPTNLQLIFDGKLIVLSGEHKGEYPFLYDQVIPINGGDKNPGEYPDGRSYDILGKIDLETLSTTIQSDIRQDILDVADASIDYAQEECGENKLDIVYLLDNSGSIDDLEYSQMKASVIATAEELVATGIDVQFAVAQFAGTCEFDVSIPMTSDETELQNLVWKFRGGTNVPSAFESLIDAIDNQEIALRPGAKLHVLFYNDAGKQQFFHLTCHDNPNSFAVYNVLKESPYDATITVIKYPTGDDAIQNQICAAIASPGNPYQGDVYDNPDDPQGTGIPRRFYPTSFDQGVPDLVDNTISCDYLDCWLKTVLTTYLEESLGDLVILQDPTDCPDCLPKKTCDLFAEDIFYNQADNNIGAIEMYNGNISHVTWINANSPKIKSYTYAYDAGNRMLHSTFGKFDEDRGQLAITNQYDSHLTFDDAGNIQTLNRTGMTGYEGLDSKYGSIDNLVMTYSQINRLKNVTETPDDIHRQNGFTSAGGGLAYDDNGNMISNVYKGISNIEYDIFNFPKRIDFDNESYIKYDYDADGNKLKMESLNVATGELKTYFYLEGKIIGDSETSFYGDGGRISYDAELKQYQAEYVINDHLGNGRVWFSDLDRDGLINCYEDEEILQIEDYYAFGMSHRTDWTERELPNENRFQYNSKEKETSLTNWVDYGARWYDASVGRFISVDLLAHLMPAWSPYSYGFNNPIRYTDPDGRAPEDIILGKGLSKAQILQTVGTLQNLTNDRLVYSTQSDGTVRVKIGSLGTGNKTAGTRLIRRLNSSDKTVEIGVGAKGSGNSANATSWTNAKNGKGSDATVNFDPTSNPGIKTVDPKTGIVSKVKGRPNEIGLGHELIHVNHIFDGDVSLSPLKNTYKTSATGTTTQSVKGEELRTVGLTGTKKTDITENQLRKENKQNKRGAY